MFNTGLMAQILKMLYPLTNTERDRKEGSHNPVIAPPWINLAVGTEYYNKTIIIRYTTLNILYKTTLFFNPSSHVK